MAEEEKTTNPHAEAEVPTPKKGKRRGGFLFKAMLVVAVILAFFFTPLLSVIIWILPNGLITALFSGIYQEITLDKAPPRFEATFKYEPPAVLPVLGNNTAVCFSFHATEISKKLLADANRAQPIASVSALGTDQKEYALRETEVYEKDTDTDAPYSVVCQNFGKSYSLPPKSVRRVTITPTSEAFTPFEVQWVTMRDIF